MSKHLTMLSLVLSTILLSGCLATTPPAPEVWQAGYSWKFRKFRACDTVTHACRDISLADPDMEGAQCLSPDDYKAVADWFTVVEQIANQRCK